MGLVLDIVLCIIALGFVVSGYKVGLVRSLIELIGYIFAIIASIMLADYAANIVSAILMKINPSMSFSPILIKIISMIITFILLQLLVQIISRALDAVFSLPGLNILNSLLGGIFGLFKGVLVVFIICAVLQLTLPLISAKNPKINESELQQSKIYQFVYTNNPVYSLFQGKFKTRYM
ncbi:MAG TPA: hypothetical protein DIW07_12510 [Lachnospiraceae bacterium]|nr:hypothetical protein [Lachnospiraceae bacterium]